MGSEEKKRKPEIEKRLLRILYVEDDTDDFSLCKKELKRAALHFEIQRVETRGDYIRELLEFRPDLVLADFNLPSFSAIEAFGILRRRQLDIPIILVSGALGEELAVEMLKSGFTDYVLKSNLAKLSPAVRRALEEAAERRKRKGLESELRNSYSRLKVALEQIIHALASAMEIRDPYTAGHQRQVALLSRAIANELGLSDFQRESVFLAGLVHDIGKIAVPAEILSKPSDLNEWEKNIIRSHPQVGFRILKDIEFPWPIAEIVLQHHERIDGSGYLRAMNGSMITLEAGILSVADVVEAMNSNRPYRPALGIRKALEEIRVKSGILYNEKAVNACLEVLRQRKFTFRSTRGKFALSSL